MTSQTTLHHFYKVISNKSIGLGENFPKKKFLQKEGKTNKSISHRKPSALRKPRQSLKMSTFVESEVQIIEVKTPPRNSNENTTSQKRTNSGELENSSKKIRVDPLTDCNIQLSTSQKTLCQSQSTLSSSQSPSDYSQFSIKSAQSPKKISQSSGTILESQNENHITPLKVKSPNSLNSTGKKSIFSPKQQLPSKIRKSISPRKLFFVDRVNIYVVQQAIENLNLVRQGSITLNEFDLEAVFQTNEFSFLYSDNIDPTSQKFEFKDIIFPHEKHADHLLMIIMDVFSEPINCGYFLKTELNQIFKLFTLSAEAQMLFVRLLKRKIGWHRTSNMKYPEIGNDLSPFFKELIHGEFCVSDLDSVGIPDLLNMLQVDEVKNICQKLKINHRGNKTVLMGRLIKYGQSSKSFFLGAKTPKSILKSEVMSVLQMCASLSEEIFNLFNRILTLLHPVQDPTENIADLFLMLTTVHKGEILYPDVSKKDPFPVFQNRSHLINYVKSKSAYKEVLISIENKEWDKVKDLGRLALQHIKEAQTRYKKSLLPLHVQKFVPEYTWTKVLSCSIDAFKKTPETIPEAVNALQTLIDDELFCQSSRGRWYEELALIEMHHKKKLETSAALTLNALQQDTLTEVDVSSLIERLKKLMRRKNGISKETKNNIQQTLDNVISRGLTLMPTSTKIITAQMASRAEAGGKSTWSITINGNDKYYGSVEVLAMQYYTSEEDFLEGLHCEGSLPITLFTVYFWNELYKIPVPGAFVSSYQEAPLDLFTAEFFKNRKTEIEEKIKFVKAHDEETFAKWMSESYMNFIQYRSIMPNTLFKTDEQFKDVVKCLGINGVTGICERLVSNYRLWRSGFPDLIVWNKLTQKCKIVEVKGPGDSLSEKQKLWLQYLEQLGIRVEVCFVEALGRSLK